MDKKSDVVIVGGGLSGALTALKFRIAQPDLHVILLEANSTIGGHHTWSFQESDLNSIDAMSWMEPLLKKSWTESTIQFPRSNKILPGKFHVLRSEDLHKQVVAILGDDVMLNSRAVRISESHVELENDKIIAARCILDARGIEHQGYSGINGFFKFIALDLTLDSDHEMQQPLRIDATCPQLDGLRYFQIFPWDARRLMVAECFYSDSIELNRERISRSILSFVERKGWKIKTQDREETGLIPIPLTSDYITRSQGGDALPIGMRGGYFHATTGRSLPDAVRVAEFLCTIKDLTTQNARAGLMKHRRAWLSRQSFYRMMNRWLFYAAEPALRYTVLQYFFDQNQDFLERFESGKTTWADRLRVISARPPVAFDRAVRSLNDQVIKSWADARVGHTSQQ